MKLFIDTNIVLDILQKREPFFTATYQAIRRALSQNAVCLFSASSVTDVFYVLRRATHDNTQAKHAIETLSHIVVFADVQDVDIFTALELDMRDVEDAVVSAVAERHRANYILTRNSKDYTGSPVPVLTPESFLLL